MPLRRVALGALLCVAARLARPLRRRRDGVLLVAMTAAGEVVLVRHRYADGWHLPGGGVRRGEGLRDAALREAREEIGLNGYDGIVAIDPIATIVRGRPATIRAFLARDVRHAPRRSLEIEEVIAVRPDRLPEGTARISRLAIARAGIVPPAR